jgi:hypothetical protein
MTSCCSFDARSRRQTGEVSRPRGSAAQLIRFAEKQQMQVSNLSAALVDARIETVFGSMKALVRSNSPVFLDFVVGNNRWHSVGRSGNFDPGDYCRGRGGYLRGIGVSYRPKD